MIGGFDSIGDMFDRGGPGKSGGSFSGGPFDGGNKSSGGGGGLLSSIGGAIGLALGGPAGAAIGSGLGSLASGGTFNDALGRGISSFGVGAMSGMGGMLSGVAGAMGGGGDGGQMGQQGPLGGSGLAGILSGATGQGARGTGGMMGPTGAAGGMGLPGILSNPMAQNLILAGLIEANEPKPVTLTPGQERTVATGERAPDYRGTMAPGTPQRTVNMAQGGFVQGPGTGTSDSIPAAIYQDGGRVQEARLSDGEFVMTADAVRGAGGGSRDQGAAKMYELMQQYERRAGAR